MNTVRTPIHIRVDSLLEVGPFCLFGPNRSDAKPAFESRPNLLRIEEGSPADLVDRDEAFGLPVTKGAEARAGRLAGEYNFDAILCADKLWVL